jgi:hypothetical protein
VGRCVYDCVALVLWSMAWPWTASAPRSPLSPRLRCAGTLVDCQSMGKFGTGTEGGAVSETALRWYFGRGLVHGKFSTEGGAVAKTA